MSVQYISNNDGLKLAYVYSPGAGPTVMFCGGYRSDMGGTKAVYLEAQCKARGQAYVRFDYSGHGDSEGSFEEGRIGSWAADAIAILDQVVDPPAPTASARQGGDVVLVGSSMGGWMAFLAAFVRPERVKGIVGIAAAPDFTEEIYARLSAAQKQQLEDEGFAAVENDYSDEPYYYSRDFYKEAKAHMVLTRSPNWDFPVHLLQGREDKDVLPETAVRICEAFGGVTVDVTYVDDGDHRLSRPQDLVLIDGLVQDMSGSV